MQAEIILRIHLNDNIFKDDEQKSLFYKATKEQQEEFLLNKALEEIEDCTYSRYDLELIKIDE